MTCLNFLIFILTTLLLLHGKSFSNITGANYRINKELARFFTREYLLRYLNYNEVINFMDEVRHEFPNYVKIESISKTEKGRDIFLVKLSNSFKDCKRITFIESGSEVFEFRLVSLALHTILQVLQDPLILNKSDWYIIPMPNPDEYARFDYANYTLNGSQHLKSADNCRVADESCPFWKLILSAVTKVKNRVETFISVEENGGKILFPYGYKKDRPLDWVELERCALEAQKTALRRGQKFNVGSSASLSNKLSKTLVDVVKDRMEVTFSYTLQLQGAEGTASPELMVPDYLFQMFPVMRTLSQCSTRYYNKY